MTPDYELVVGIALGLLGAILVGFSGLIVRVPTRWTDIATAS